MKVYLKSGTEAETRIEPMVLAQIAQTWRADLIVVALNCYIDDHEFFANIMSIDLDRTFAEPGQQVVLRAVY